MAVHPPNMDSGAILVAIRKDYSQFIKARQQQPLQLKADMEKFMSQLQAKEAQPPQLLHNSVLRYDDPFAPVAEADWESLQ